MKRTIATILLLAPVQTPAAAGEAARETASLESLLQEAHDNSPALRAAEARLEAARRVPSQAQTPPDPEVSVTYMNVGTDRFTLGEDDFTLLSLGWTQEVPYPGKLRKAAEVATREAERAARDLERSRLELAAAVKIAYADLYRLDRTASILVEARTALESFAQTARRRYEVGQGIQENVLKAQTEILRLEAELARVARERRTEEVRLNAVVGRAADSAIGPVSSLPGGDLPDQAETLPELALSSSPEVGILEAAVRRAEASVQLARLNLKPDFTWSAAYQNRGGFDPILVGAFSVRLPIRRERKQAQAVLQAESDLLAARRDLHDRQVRIRSMVRDLISRVQKNQAILTIYDQGVIPQARSTLESAQVSYGVGRIGFLDLLSDLTALLNARMVHVDHEAEWFQSLAALEPLLARELIPVPGGREEGGARHATDS